MNSCWPFENRFAQWYSRNQHDPDRRLHREALEQIVGAVKAGEITTLDGMESPLSKKIAEHHGLAQFEMNFNWVCSAQNWSCPCCSRTKFQVSRPGTKGQILAKLVVHHDHMGEALMAAFLKAFRVMDTKEAQVEGKRLVERIGNAFAAYEEVLVCEDCNNADSKAKRSVGTPSYFSFSISQIRSFIRVGDHRPHEVELAKAEQAWKSAKSAYDLRMRLIDDVAHAAATSNHWYEPHPRASCAVPVMGVRTGWPGDFTMLEWVYVEPLADSLGRSTAVSEPNLSRWRSGGSTKAQPLPSNFLAILCSDEHKAESWAALPDDWCCPICKRDKKATVDVGLKGKIGFNTKSGPRKGSWSSIPRFCNHCFTVLSALKREVTQAHDGEGHDTYAVVSPEELASIISAKSNTPHAVRSKEAAELVRLAISRLSAGI